MKWIFFLIVVGVLVYLVYSNQFSFMRQFSPTDSSSNVSVQEGDGSSENETSGSDAELESNILNTMKRIKKQ